jgi:hypothetical protein
MRIGWMSDAELMPGFYRGLVPALALEGLRGHEQRALPPAEGDPLPPLQDLDIVHIHRFHGKRAVQIARAAKANGAAVVWDDDDAPETLPRNHLSHRAHGGVTGARKLTALKWMFGVADLVTTPSAVLAERLEAIGAARSAVIENYLPDEWVQQPGKRANDGTTIGWVLGKEHRIDLDRLPIRDALQRLLDERPSVRVESVGLALGLRGDRYTHVEAARMDRLLASRICDWDIGIAPIADLDFNRVRSNVKLKEYGAGGAPWLASPIGPYVGMGEQQGGRLVPDDRWYEELARLVDRPRERRKLAKRAARWAAGETIARNVERWEAAFGEAIERARHSAGARA